jgi:hypothetical protein
MIGPKAIGMPDSALSDKLNGPLGRFQDMNENPTEGR